MQKLVLILLGVLSVGHALEELDFKRADGKDFWDARVSKYSKTLRNRVYVVMFFHPNTP